HHVHADPLVKQLLQLIGQGEVLHHKRVEGQTQIFKSGLKQFGYFLAKLRLVGSHVEKRNLTLGEGIGQGADDGVTKLAFEFRNLIFVTGTADLLIKDLGIADVIRVDAKSANAYGAKLFVADGDGLRRAPVLVN